jgi:hypothetical protein
MPFINIDLVKADIPSEKRIIVLAFGDEVKVINTTPQQIEIELSIIKNGTHTKVSGFIKNKKVGGKEILVDANNNVLKVDYIDVQQGDGSVIQTPQGKIMHFDYARRRRSFCGFAGNFQF